MFTVGGNIESVTTETTIKKSNWKSSGNEAYFIDTPGLADT